MKRHHLPEFTFCRLRNGGILIEDASIESLRLGLLSCHFLIHVEYRNSSSTDINIEVIHRKSVEDVMAFFEAERNNIIKYFCKNEAEFELYLKEQKTLVAAERNKTRKTNVRDQRAFRKV